MSINQFIISFLESAIAISAFAEMILDIVLLMTELAAIKLYYFMHNPWLNKTIKFILISLIFIVTIFHLLRGIQDLDFFWHLKTGEWIWQNKSLPTEDPFAYTTPPIHSSRKKFVLTSCWLSQVTYYLIYILSLVKDFPKGKGFVIIESSWVKNIFSSY